MDYKLYADELIKMKNYDLQVRQQLADSGELFGGYNKMMEQVHINNAHRLDLIVTEIGWTSKGKVGIEARDAAMVILQHAISLPDFQKKCLCLIEDAIDKKQEDKRNYAFLYDRICFYERKPQKSGTQYYWDENNELSSWIIEDPDNVNKSRKEYGLNTIEEEIKATRVGSDFRGNLPQENFQKREKRMLEWCKQTGWVK